MNSTIKMCNRYLKMRLPFQNRIENVLIGIKYFLKRMIARLN